MVQTSHFQLRKLRPRDGEGLAEVADELVAMPGLALNLLITRLLLSCSATYEQAH